MLKRRFLAASPSPRGRSQSLAELHCACCQGQRAQTARPVIEIRSRAETVPALAKRTLLGLDPELPRLPYVRGLSIRQAVEPDSPQGGVVRQRSIHVAASAVSAARSPLPPCPRTVGTVASRREQKAPVAAAVGPGQSTQPGPRATVLLSLPARADCDALASPPKSPHRRRCRPQRVYQRSQHVYTC